MFALWKARHGRRRKAARRPRTDDPAYRVASSIKRHPFAAAGIGFLFLFLIAGGFGTSHKGAAKHDIQGWKTGMSHDDVLKQLEATHCSSNNSRASLVKETKPLSPYEFFLVAECGSDRFVFEFTP